MTRLDRTSEAQANALYARDTPYTEAHASSWVIRNDFRVSEPKSLRGFVSELRRLYADAAPLRIHEGPTHIDAGGSPAVTAAFLNYVDGSGNLIGKCLDDMRHAGGQLAWYAAITTRIVCADEAPLDAAMAEGSHVYQAKDGATDALRCLWRRYVHLEMGLGRTETAA